MRLVHDQENGTAVLELVEDAEVAETVDTETGVNLDFDEDGSLVCVEIWASDRIPEQFFQEDEVEDRSVDELLEQLQQSVRDAAEGRTKTVDELREELEDDSEGDGQSD